MLHFIWDYEILSLIAGTALGSFLFLRRAWTERKTLSKRLHVMVLLSGAFFVFILFIVVYGSFIEPRWILVKEQRIHLNKTAQEEHIRVVVVSDLHPGPYKQAHYFERVAEKIKKIQPDVILLDGDLIATMPGEVKYLAPLANVTKVFPTYAVTGNHEYDLSSATDYYRGKMIDHSGPVMAFLKEMGVQRLQNQGQLLNIRGGLLYLAGIDDMWSQLDSIEQTLQSVGGMVSPDMPTLLMAHNADITLTKGAKYFDLIVSGHTHGGQVRLPLIGPLLIPNVTGRTYDRGWFSLPSGNQLYITAGLGESGPRARLMNRPEITVLDIDL